MKRKISAVITVLFLVLACSGAWAGAFSMKNYSADMETTTSKGTITSRVYVKDGKRRTEMKSGGQASINIMRPDKKLVWMVMPANKMYMEISLDPRKQDVASQLNDPNIKVDKEFLGNETIDGHPAKKYHITTVIDGKKEKSGYTWEATDLDNLPIKYQSEDQKITTVWKNIQSGGVSDPLFEVPAGFKKMEMPNMGGMKMPKK